jgi:hypothetical protein
MPGASDVDEANWITSQLEGAFHFLPSRNDPPRPAIFSTPERTRTTIFVYYVRDKKTQLDIVGFLKKLRSNKLLKPIIVEFYREEETDRAEEQLLEKYEIK